MDSASGDRSCELGSFSENILSQLRIFLPTPLLVSKNVIPRSILVILNIKAVPSTTSRLLARVFTHRRQTIQLGPLH